MFNLEAAVGNGKVVQDSESEDCVNLPFLTAVSRFNGFFISFLLCCSPIAVHSKTDFQIWNANVLSGSLNKQVDLLANIEFRYRDDGTTFYYNHEHFELPIHICSFIDLGPSYRQIFRLNAGTTNQWSTFYVPNLNLTFFWNVHDFYFSDRSRISYIMAQAAFPDIWQYRNRLSVYKIIKQGPRQIRLFAEDEIFFAQQTNGVFENRTSIGLNFFLFKKIKLDIGYRFRIVKQIDGWEHNNILLLNTYASF